jgi:hypothetical protein
MWVTSAANGRLFAVDPQTWSAEREFVPPPVGMTIVDGAFYLVTVDEDWGDSRFERLGIDDDATSLQTLRSLSFKPRSVAFDGERFWTADRTH